MDKKLKIHFAALYAAILILLVFSVITFSKVNKVNNQVNEYMEIKVMWVGEPRFAGVSKSDIGSKIYLHTNYDEYVELVEILEIKGNIVTIRVKKDTVIKHNLLNTDIYPVRFGEDIWDQVKDQYGY